MKFTFIFYLAMVFIFLTIVSVRCKMKDIPLINNDNELNKTIFVNGYWKGILAVRVMINNGTYSNEAINLKAFKDSVDFANYIDKK